MDLAQRIACCSAILLALAPQHSLAVYGAETQASPEESQLLETLRSGAPADRAIACKKLAIYGSKAAAPELAKLLADEQLASWARIALEAIPDPAIDAVLNDAAKMLEGRLLVGVINSIGVRRSEIAVEQLAGRLSDQDDEVASAAAVALGRIGNDAATKTLRNSLAGAAPGVRSAVAEGCILCAERLVADSNAAEAAALFDEVRRAEVPQPRILEATRGAILARQSEGLPLLMEVLKSPDKKLFQLGLGVAREVAGNDVADAIATELAQAPPERAALLLYALADRPQAVLSPAMRDAASSGDKRLRLAAIEVIGRLGDADNMPELLTIAAEPDGDLAQSAKAALAALPGETVDAEIMKRLGDAEGPSLVVLIELVGLRRIEATPALVTALGSSDADVRLAALTALGATIGPQDFHVLVARVLRADSEDDAEASGRALEAAAVRMPDRDATARVLAAAMPRASKANKERLIRILGVMGGPVALESIAVALKDGDDQLLDTGTRVLGGWMTVDAAPVLLNLAKAPENAKFQVRALRGYIRLARQFAMADKQRADMCRQALEAAARPAEQKLVLPVLQRYPSVETLAVAVESPWMPELKQDAADVAREIAQKVGAPQAEVQDVLQQ
jgi:HEAT repeat protein